MLTLLAAAGAIAAGVAGLQALYRLRVPAGADLASVHFNAANLRAAISQIAVAACGAFVLGGALICASIYAAYVTPSPLDRPQSFITDEPLSFYVGVLVAIAGPLWSILAARRARALTAAAAAVMEYELALPFGLRDHDAALESALAAEGDAANGKRGAHLQLYARARMRALRRSRPSG